MQKMIIEGGRKLSGTVTVSGSKNAALPILAASMLTSGWSTFSNIPKLRDIRTICTLLGVMGAEVERSGDEVRVRTDSLCSVEAPYELVKTMRASVLALGPLMARLGQARISLPGGCAIGARPIDQHLKGLEQMGASICISGGYVNAKAEGLRGAVIRLERPTVTGTENLMMAATGARGTTVIENAACEPEVAELADVLIKMGAAIDGAGTGTVKIEGGRALRAIDHTIVPDRIEAGTLIAAAAITGGEVFVRSARLDHLQAVAEVLGQAGVEIEANPEGILARRAGVLNPLEVTTLPYPGFPTDMQAQIMALMTQAEGRSIIKETIFENRFMHVGELRRLGANIDISGPCATIMGPSRLEGAPVMATDLRASASLVLAALVASGKTEVSRIYHLDRGYENLEEKLSALGARIWRVEA